MPLEIANLLGAQGSVHSASWLHLMKVISVILSFNVDKPEQQSKACWALWGFRMPWEQAAPQRTSRHQTAAALSIMTNFSEFQRFKFRNAGLTYFSTCSFLIRNEGNAPPTTFFSQQRAETNIITCAGSYASDILSYIISRITQGS